MTTADTQFNQRIIALAGCCQAAMAVNRLAHNGWIEDHYLETAIKSVLNLDPVNAEDVVGSREMIKSGFNTLLEQLYPKGSRDLEVGRYVANLVSLENQFMKSDELVQIVRTRLTQIKKQQQLYHKNHDETIKSIASLYQDTLSNLPLKIQVTGQARFLQKEEVQQQVRTLLFFGLRCAVLWKQLGGRKRDFIFKRRQIAEAINDLSLTTDNL